MTNDIKIKSFDSKHSMKPFKNAVRFVTIKTGFSLISYIRNSNWRWKKSRLTHESNDTELISAQSYKIDAIHHVSKSILIDSKKSYEVAETPNM